MSQSHLIGRRYRYPNSEQVFVLKQIDKWVYRFECGKWCSDSIFEDLFDIEAGEYNYKLLGVQLKLF